MQPLTAVTISAIFEKYKEMLAREFEPQNK